MYNLTLNIGLNVGKEEPTRQLFRTKSYLLNYFNFPQEDVKVEQGQWKDDEGNTIKERVCIIRLNVGNMSIHAINNILTSLCWELKQDGIAFKLGGVGRIAYNKEYEGEQYPFNPKYFREF